MKKLIAIAVVLALVAGVAFAADGIEINAWGRGAFTPLKYFTPHQTNGEIDKGPDGNNVEGESYAGVTPTWGAGQSWSNGRARVDFRIAGVSDYVGFKLHAAAETDGLSTNDYGAHIWAKPFGSDILKLTVGMFIDDTLRGKIGGFAHEFETFVLPAVQSYGEDAIFNRFGCSQDTYSVYGNAPAGFMISSAPVDGLFLGLMVRGAMDGGSMTEAALAYQYMQLGAGYNIADIGHIRAQYIGGWSGSKDSASKDDTKYFDPTSDTGKLARIEFAFALTAVQGLLIDVGTKIGLPLEVKFGSVTSAYSSGIGFGVGATFSTGAFGIGARMDISGLGAYTRADKDNDKSEGGATTVIRVVPTFDVGEVTLGLDVAFAAFGESKNAVGDKQKDDGSQLGFGAFVSKGLGKGSITAGLSYTLPPNNHDGKANGSGVFQLPIILEYAFF